MLTYMSRRLPLQPLRLTDSLCRPQLANLDGDGISNDSETMCTDALRIGQRKN